MVSNVYLAWDLGNVAQFVLLVGNPGQAPLSEPTVTQ